MSNNKNQFDVTYVAHLARLQLTEQELKQFSAQLQNILDYVAKLNKLDVSSVEPTSHAVPLTNVLRKDDPTPPIERERILANAPESARGLFITPKIVE